MRSIYIASFIALISSSAMAAAPDAHSSVPRALEKANAFYEKADCENAIRLYKAIRKSPEASAEDRDTSSFRIGYCAYNSGDLDTAIEEFGDLLKAHPQEDEARLRYAESLFAKNEFQESIDNALKVEDEDFINDARLLAARGYLEIQETEKALAELDKLYGKDSSLDPVVEFWRGLAHFQGFNESSAEQSLRKAWRTSPANYWTKSASVNWLKTLLDAKSPIHARVGLSYGYDNNVAQMTYKTSSTGSPDTSYYVADSYSAFDATISTHAIRTDNIAWVPSITAYGQFYSKSDNSSYNPFTTTADLTATIAASYKWTYRASIFYTDSRYNHVLYQEYLGTNLAAMYAISKHSTAHFGLGLTEIVGHKDGWTYGPTVGLEGDATDFYWLANLAYSATTGEKATFTTSSGTTTVATGATGANYASESARAGIGHVFASGIDLLGQLSVTKTQYGKEDAPSSAAFSIDPRGDLTWSAQLSLSKTLIERRMTLTASYIYSKTTSDGFQGLLSSSGTSADYNITRSLASAYLSYGF